MFNVHRHVGFDQRFQRKKTFTIPLIILLFGQQKIEEHFSDWSFFMIIIALFFASKNINICLRYSTHFSYRKIKVFCRLSLALSLSRTLSFYHKHMLTPSLSLSLSLSLSSNPLECAKKTPPRKKKVTKNISLKRRL